MFERFRSESIKVYELDPVHFCTAPTLSWHACLKYTRVTLDILTDPNMNIFINGKFYFVKKSVYNSYFEGAFIGGVSKARNPFLQANNPSVPGFDPKLLMTWLLLVDCNNQYGWAMSQYLPVGGFKWEEDLTQFTEDKIKSLNDEREEGFLLEVDLEYPQELHDKHDQVLVLSY